MYSAVCPVDQKRGREAGMSDDHKAVTEGNKNRNAGLANRAAEAIVAAFRELGDHW